MSHTSNTQTGPELINPRQTASQTHDEAGRIRVRAHRMCGFLADQRSEGGSSQQEDGWYFFVQRRYFVQRIPCLSPVRRSGRHGRNGFRFARPPERIV